MKTETKQPSTVQRDATIRALINRPYDTAHDRPCWAFARDCLRVFGIDLPASPRAGLVRVDAGQIGPQIGAVVMFAGGFDWHCGVIWPDGLHFIHAMPPRVDLAKYFEIRLEQLCADPWAGIIEGYYVPKNQ